MIYRCFNEKCGWSGPDGEVAWKEDRSISEAWGHIRSDRGEYATCPDCGTEDIAEDDTQGADDEDSIDGDAAGDERGSDGG